MMWGLCFCLHTSLLCFPEQYWQTWGKRQEFPFPHVPLLWNDKQYFGFCWGEQKGWIFVCFLCPSPEHLKKILRSFGSMGTCREHIGATVGISHHSLALHRPHKSWQFLGLSRRRSSDGPLKKDVSSNILQRTNGMPEAKLLCSLFVQPHLFSQKLVDRFS